MKIKPLDKEDAEYPFTSFCDPELNPETGKNNEWLLTNGLGGYSSSTILGLNTRKYHGLLISSNDKLKRSLYLHKLDEEIHTHEVTSLGCNEFSDTTLTDGWKYLKEFNYNYNAVSFHYETDPARITKKIKMLSGMNATVVEYTVTNKLDEIVQFRVNLIVNARGIHELSDSSDKKFETKFFTEKIVGIKNLSGPGYLTVYSDNAACSKTPASYEWIKDLYYSREDERGDPAVEDAYFPASFSINLDAGEKKKFRIIAVGCETEEETAAAFKKIQEEKRDSEKKSRILSNGFASNLIMLLETGEGFIVDRDSKKSIIAGFHWFGEWGRDAMISLPGLTLVNHRLEDADLIFQHFLNNAGPTGIANRFDDGNPGFNDYDSTLWMIDRLYQYKLYAGPEKTRQLVRGYWDELKRIIESYMKIETDGIINHESGTWMDTLQRNNAVEVQALWYNALKVMEDLALLVKDKEFDVRCACERFENNFFDRYWNGRYLNDCEGDESLRPNQLIALSLDHTVIDERSAMKILDIVEKELLTPYGIRTLEPSDLQYRGVYEGNFTERENSYHNGTVWPWLLGPYIKAYSRIYNKKGTIKNLLEPLLNKHLREAGLGSISEVFDGDAPHRPKGCISQAWSVAELLRAYSEDYLERRPTPQKRLKIK